MLTGDFNHSSTSWDDLGFPTTSKKSETHFTDFVRSSNLFQHVGFPTFLMPASEAKSTLDLIFTEKSNRIDNLAAGPPLADLRRGHVSLKFDFILDSPGYTMTHSSKLNFKRAKFNEITNHFDSIKWDKALSPLDYAHNAYEYFLEEYNKACVSYVPLRKLRRSNDPLWMNKDLKKRIKEKHRLWFKFKSVSRSNAGNRTELQEQYRAVSKELKTDIRKEVIEFESNLAKNSKTDPKMLYSYIRSKQLTNNRITTLTSDSGEDLSTPAEIADSLNTYFQSVFVKDKTVEEGLPHFASRTCTSCNDDGKAIFTLEALHREIDNLKDNKAIGLDKASPVILKRCKAALSEPLLIIFQKSFSESVPF